MNHHKKNDHKPPLLHRYHPLLVAIMNHHEPPSLTIEAWDINHQAIRAMKRHGAPELVASDLEPGDPAGLVAPSQGSLGGCAVSAMDHDMVWWLNMIDDNGDMMMRLWLVSNGYINMVIS